MPARHPALSTGRPLGSRAGETRSKVLALLLGEHARSGLWLGRDALAQRLGISPQAASGHRRQLIRDGQLDAEAASPDRALRTQRLPFRLVLVDEHALSGEKAAPGQLDLVELLTRAADACFAVQVTDGMKVPALGILAGAYVIVDPALRRTRGRYILVRTQTKKPGGAKLAIRQVQEGRKLPSEDVLGVVVSVVRRLLP